MAGIRLKSYEFRREREAVLKRTRRNSDIVITGLLVGLLLLVVVILILVLRAARTGV